jgi:hypothetical protein
VHVSKFDDSAGFDVQFTMPDQCWHLEVKTTVRRGRLTIHLSRNEYCVSRRDDGWALAEVVAVLGTRLPRIAFSTGSPEAIPPAVREMGPLFAKPYDPVLLAKAVLRSPKGSLISRLRGALG